MATLTDDLERTRRARDHFENLIQNPELLGPDFQPVRRLADDTIEGWQASGRGNVGPDLSDRETFAQTAMALGLAERLDWTFRCRILDVAAERGISGALHLRPSFASYGTPPPPRLAVAFGRSRSMDVVAEVHDQAYADPDRLRTGLDEFARWGWRVSVGDISDRADCGAILQRIRPSFATVDLARPGRATSDAAKRYAETTQRLGIELIAVGIDNPTRTGEAMALGATLGRGTALGAPGELPG